MLSKEEAEEMFNDPMRPMRGTSVETIYRHWVRDLYSGLHKVYATHDHNAVATCATCKEERGESERT